MSMMLKGLNAIRTTPPCKVKGTKKKVETVSSIKKDLVSMNMAQRRLHCQAQLSTVVKMAAEGYSHNEIMLSTGVSKSFVSETKVVFELVRPSLTDDRIVIKNAIMESEDFTHKVSTLHKLTGIRKERIRNIIEKIPQIERGTARGIMYHYKYNFDIVLGDGAIARGAVY
jgi:uncharacterized protein YerC